MIARIWHGWTSAENADRYEDLLRTRVFPDIEARRIEGYQGIRLLRRSIENDEVEFVTLMWFEDLEAVRRFVGSDLERAHVPEEARRVLARFDKRTLHYDLRQRRDV